MTFFIHAPFSLLKRFLAKSRVNKALDWNAAFLRGRFVVFFKGIIVLAPLALFVPINVNAQPPVINNVVRVHTLPQGRGISTDTNRLQDIQIGESGRFLRVALFCRLGCAISQRRDGFYLEGLQDQILIDIEDQSVNAQRLTMVPQATGSLLKIQSESSVLRSLVKECKIQKADAVCIDLEYGDNPLPPDRIAQKEGHDILKAVRKEPSPVTKEPLRVTTFSQWTVAAPNRPNSVVSSNTSAALREGAQSSSFIVEGDNANPILLAATPKPLVPNVSLLRPVQTQLVLNRVDFREYAETILDRRFDSENCSNAQAKLQDDAWDLEAMRMVGFCIGAKGDFEQAEIIFKTLLTQNDQNFEAMIGRGLIARVTGEKSVSKRFFNDAMKTRLPKDIEARLNETINDF